VLGLVVLDAVLAHLPGLGEHPVVDAALLTADLVADVGTDPRIPVRDDAVLDRNGGVRCITSVR
jgi:hypothetical protein